MDRLSKPSDLEQIYSDQIGIGKSSIVELPRRPKKAAGARSAMPESAFRTELTKLAAQLFLSKGSASPRVVAFSSIEERAKETGITARTGELLASLISPQSVCVVDANPSSPSVHRIFGVPNERGWSEFMAQGISARQHAQPIAGANFWVMPCGASVPFILARDYVARLRHQVKALCAEFDYVLIQAPLAESTETCHLSKVCDGLVLVLEDNSTQRDKALNVTSHLKHVGVQILGAVLKDNSAPVPDAISRNFR